MGFFGKKNIINALWALLLAFICFLAGTIYKTITGPERVIIAKDESRCPKDTTISIIRFEGDSATMNAIKSFNPNLTVKPSNDNYDINNASVAQNKIVFPSIVEGYTQQSINSYASVEIPRQTYSKGEMIEFKLKIFDYSIIKKISPLFIEIVKITGDNSMSYVWDEQFTITHQNNTIRFSSDFPKDEYQLAIGFYLMDEIHQKFPPFYSKRFKLIII